MITRIGCVRCAEVAILVPERCRFGPSDVFCISRMQLKVRIKPRNARTGYEGGHSQGSRAEAREAGLDGDTRGLCKTDMAESLGQESRS